MGTKPGWNSTKNNCPLYLEQKICLDLCHKFFNESDMSLSSWEGSTGVAKLWILQQQAETVGDEELTVRLFMLARKKNGRIDWTGPFATTKWYPVPTSGVSHPTWFFVLLLIMTTMLSL